jgi:hypothetical protein
MEYPQRVLYQSAIYFFWTIEMYKIFEQSSPDSDFSTKECSSLDSGNISYVSAATAALSLTPLIMFFPSLLPPSGHTHSPKGLSLSYHHYKDHS